MFDKFSDQIRTRHTSLGNLVAKEEDYKPLWTNFAAVPNAGNGGNNNAGNGGNNGGGGGRDGGGGGASSLSHPNNSNQVNQQIQRLQEQNQRHLQSVDRMRSDHAKALRAEPSAYPGASSNGLGDHRKGFNNGKDDGARQAGGGNGHGNGGNGGGGSGYGGGGKKGGGGGGGGSGYGKDPIKRHKNDRR